MYYLLPLNTFPTITQFYSVTRNTVWKISDKDDILLFITEGRCRISFANEQFELKKGDIFYIPCNHPYTRYSIEGEMCTMTYIHFSTPSESEQLDARTLGRKIFDAKKTLDTQILSHVQLPRIQNSIYLQNKLRLKDYSRVFRLLDEIQFFSAKRQLMCGLQSSLTLCSILSFLSQHTIETLSADIPLKSVDTISPNLKQAIRYIRTHYAEQITLDELATHCSVSKQQLIRYFHSTFHMTPIAYITDYKISRAKDLLFNQPHLTIKEVSDELGFSDQHYFSKVFTKVAGETPSQYRQRVLFYDPINE